MKLPTIKKIEDLKKILSYKSFVYISLWVLVFLIVAGLVLDMWVFYIYGYKAVNMSVTSDYAATLKRKDLTDVVNMLDEKKQKSDSILKYGVKDAPPVFR